MSGGRPGGDERAVAGTTPQGLLLPAGTRMVHIGPQKTGSTAIQAAMNNARATLLEHGVRYAGQGTRPREAGWAMLGIGVPVGRKKPGMERWDALVREVEGAAEARVCISNEDFAKAGASAAARVVEDLGAERVHIVAVARRLDRLLPSQWQERVKARQTLSYEDWLREILGEPSDSATWRNVWVPHDVESLVERWAGLVGPERFTLILSDDSDRMLLPRTFEAMLGLPRGLLELDSTLSNRSLSLNEAELVRHLNERFAEHGWQPDAYLDFMQRGVIPRLKSRPRAADDLPIPRLPPWAAERVRQISDRRAEAVKAMDVRVVGDPDCLRVPSRSQSSAPTQEVTVSLEVATRAVEGAIASALRRERLATARHEKRLDRAKRRRPELSGRELVVALTKRVSSRLRGS
jgi:hypothetical protein